MRRILSSVVLAALLAGCNFIVTVDDASYRVSVRPLVPSPTDTPPATATAPPPTVTPTATPTITPSPTATLTPSATFTPSNTPTPEAAQPTPTAELTPVPTVPPDDGDKLCLVKLGGFAINERTAPSVTAPKTPYSPIPGGSIVKVLEVTDAGGYLWARNYSGWFVIRQGATWLVYGVSGATELCDEVPGWPPGLAPPADLVRTEFGLWVGPGADLSELLAFGQAVRAAGIQPAATVYGNDNAARILYGAGWTVALRPWIGDCPNSWAFPAENSGRDWANRAVDSVAGLPYHWLSLSNECGGWPSAQYARDWIAAAIDQAARRGVRAVVPVVWNSGAPEIYDIPVLATAYQESRIAVAWGLNVYPVTVGVALAERTPYTLYTTWRWQFYRSLLTGIPLVVTEAARGDGSEPAVMADLGQWARAVDGAFLWATFWYHAMPLGHWRAATLLGRLTDLARVLQ